MNPVIDAQILAAFDTVFWGGFMLGFVVSMAVGTLLARLIDFVLDRYESRGFHDS